MLKWSVWLQDAALKGANSRKLKTPRRLCEHEADSVSRLSPENIHLRTVIKLGRCSAAEK